MTRNMCHRDTRAAPVQVRIARVLLTKHPGIGQMWVPEDFVVASVHERNEIPDVGQVDVPIAIAEQQDGQHVRDPRVPRLRVPDQEDIGRPTKALEDAPPQPGAYPVVAESTFQSLVPPRVGHRSTYSTCRRRETVAV